MRKGALAGVILVIAVVVILTILFFPKTIFAVNPIGASHLEELRLNADVECLQNSQCPEGSECVGNACIDKKEADKCETISLNTPTRQIWIGSSINSVKEVLTKVDLPFLLSDGEFVKMIDGKAVKYFYSSTILIGSNKIEKEADKYSIQNDKPLYTYRLTFSNGIDFSDKDIQGQAIKILGEEYSLGSNSDNSNIYLISEKTKVQLQNKDNIDITKDEKGNVIRIEIAFSSQNSVKDAETNTDSFFNSTKLSFNSVNEDFADVRIGGNC
jgi:hypothetical protein